MANAIWQNCLFLVSFGVIWAGASNNSHDGRIIMVILGISIVGFGPRNHTKCHQKWLISFAFGMDAWPWVPFRNVVKMVAHSKMRTRSALPRKVALAMLATMGLMAGSTAGSLALIDAGLEVEAARSRATSRAMATSLNRISIATVFGIYKLYLLLLNLLSFPLQSIVPLSEI